MSEPIVQSHSGVTLVGGAPVEAGLIRRAMAHAPVLVAADGGGDTALAAGLVPEAVIGDFDSLSAAALERLPSDRLHRVPEQETTDFEKCLTRIAAPIVLALGFSGARADHGLAVWNVLVRHPAHPCLVIGSEDIAFLAPERLVMRLGVGTRVSLFPMRPVAGESRGLRWPITGIAFAPDGRIGTSNIASEETVELRFSDRAMLVIVPLDALDSVIAALLPPREA